MRGKTAYGGVFSGWLLGMLLMPAVAHAQLLLPTDDVAEVDAERSDTDPQLIWEGFAHTAGTNPEGQCEVGANGRRCTGIIEQRIGNLIVEDDGRITFDLQIRSLEPPDPDIDFVDGINVGTSISDEVRGNLLHSLSLNLRWNPAALDLRPPADADCAYTPQDSLGDTDLFGILPLVSPSLVTYDAGQVGGISDNGPDRQVLPSGEVYDLAISSGAFQSVVSVTCPAGSVTDNTLPMQFAFGNTFNAGTRVAQLTSIVSTAGDDSFLPYALRAENQFWYYPLDGLPAITDAEMGNALDEDGFYIDLTFSEPVYGDTGGTSALTPAAFDFLVVREENPTFLANAVSGERIHRIRQLASEEGTVAMGVPVSVTKVGGGALTGDEVVVRLHFAETDHPLILRAVGESVLNDGVIDTDTVPHISSIGIRPTAGEEIYDADGNQLHGGNDWWMVVLHDRYAPYVTDAVVSLASRHIDLTFSKPVRFEIQYDETAPDTPNILDSSPEADDFEIIHYDASGSGEPAILTPESVAVLMRDTVGTTRVRVVLPPGEYTAEDTVDVRLARKLEDPQFPSLATVFDAGGETKGASNFPRTAAHAQVGSLQLRDGEQYSIAFTEAVVVGVTGEGAADLTAAEVAEVAAADDPLPPPQPEQSATDAVVWGFLITRGGDIAEQSTVTVQVDFNSAESTGDLADAAVAIGIKDADGTPDPGGFTALPVTDDPADDTLLVEDLQFAPDETMKLLVVGVVGNDVPTLGNRLLTIELTVTDADTRAVSAPSTIRFIIEEDDDFPLIYTASDLNVDAGMENALQMREPAGAGVLIDASATVSEGGLADGVARIVIELELTDAVNTPIAADDVSFTRLRVTVAANGNPLPVEPQNIAGGLYQVGQALTDNAIGAKLAPSDTGFLQLIPLDGDTNNPAPATPAAIEALLHLLRFVLTETDDDVGAQARIRITLVPPDDAGESDPVPQTYTMNIAPDDDPPTGTVPAAALGSVNEDETSAGSPFSNDAVITGLNPAETGQTIASVILVEQSVQGDTNADVAVVENSGDRALVQGFSVVFDDAADATTLTLSAHFAPNFYGTWQFKVEVEDSGGVAATFPAADDEFFTLVVNSIDDPPGFTATAVTIDEDLTGLEFRIAIADASNGPEERPVIGAGNPVALEATSFDGFPGSFALTGAADTMLTDATGDILITGLAENANGVGTITLRLTESDTEPPVMSGLSEVLTTERVVDVIINPVNDPPQLCWRDRNAANPCGPTNRGDPPEILIDGNLVMLPLELQDPDIAARMAGLSPGNPEVLGYSVGSTLTVAVNVEGADAESINLDVVAALQDGTGFNSLDMVFSVTGTRAMDASSGLISFTRTSGGAAAGELMYTRVAATGATGTNRQILTITVTEVVLQPALNAFLRAGMQASIDANTSSADANRRIQIRFMDAGNDGEDGASGAPAMANEDIDVPIGSDPLPIVTVSPVTVAEADVQQLAGIQLFSDDETLFNIREFNEDPQLGRGVISGGNHGAAIQTVEVVASTPVGTIAETGSFAGASLLGDPPDSRYEFSFSERADGVVATIRFFIGVDQVPMTTDEAETALRALRFRLAEDNQDPPDSIDILLSLTPPPPPPLPADDIINQTLVLVVQALTITEDNDPPVTTPPAAMTRVDYNEDDVPTEALDIVTFDPVESGQRLAVQTSTREIVAAQPNNLDGDPNALFVGGQFNPVIVFDEANNVGLLQLPVPQLVSNRYGTIMLSIVVEDVEAGSGVPGGAVSDVVSFVLSVAPVPDPVVTTPAGATVNVSANEGGTYSITYTVEDGPLEDDAITLFNPNLLLERYADTDTASGHTTTLSGDLFGGSVVVTANGESLTAVTLDQGLTVASGTDVTLAFEPQAALLDFNGTATLMFELADADGTDGVSSSVARIVVFDIAPVNDNLDFVVPGCGLGETDAPDGTACGVAAEAAVIARGGSESNVVTSVVDPDVDVIAIAIAGGADDLELLGNDAPYFAVADTVRVTIAPANPGSFDAAELMAFADTQSIDNPAAGGIDLTDFAAITDSTDAAQGLVSQLWTFNAVVPAATARSLLEGITVSIDADAPRENRRVTVAVMASANDGLNGNQGVASAFSKTFELSTDPVPVVTFDPDFTGDMDESALREGRPVFSASLLVEDSNEDEHLNAIASVQVAAEAVGDDVEGRFESAVFSLDASLLPSFDDYVLTSVPSAMPAATIVRADNEPMSVEEVTNVLRALRLSDDHPDPAALIRLTVTLTPITTDPLVNQNPAVMDRELAITRFDDDQTATLTQTETVILEDAADGVNVLIGTADSMERRQNIVITDTSRVDLNSPNNIANPGELFVQLPQFTVSRGADTSVATIEFNYGSLASDRYGVILFDLMVAEEPEEDPGADNVVLALQYRLEVAPVADPLTTDPPQVVRVAENMGEDPAENVAAAYGGSNFRVFDGPGENDRITISNPRLELRRYAGTDPGYVAELTGAALDDNAEIMIGGEQLTSADSVTIGSGNTLAVMLRLLSGTAPGDGTSDFNGQVRLTLDLQDEPGADGVSSSTDVTVVFDVIAANDPLEFDLIPEDLCDFDETPPCDNEIIIGAGDTGGPPLITNVRDVDVDPSTVVGVLLDGNGANYFRAGDFVEIEISSVAADLTAEQAASVANDHTINVPDLAADFADAGMDAGMIERDEEAGTARRRITFNQGVPPTEARSILEGISITVTPTVTYQGPRLVSVTVTSPPNDGLTDRDRRGPSVTTLTPATPSFVIFGDDNAPTIDLSGDEISAVTETQLRAGTPLFGAGIVVDDMDDADDDERFSIASILISVEALAGDTGGVLESGVLEIIDPNEAFLFDLNLTATSGAMPTLMITLSREGGLDTIDVENVLRGLRFRDDHPDPASTLRVTVTLTPVDSPLVNQNPTVATKDLTVMRDDDPPVITLPAPALTVVLGSAPSGEFVPVGTVSSQERRQSISGLTWEMTVVDSVDIPSNLDRPEDLFSVLPQFRAVPDANTPDLSTAVAVIEFNYGTLVPGRHGAVDFLLSATETPEAPGDDDAPVVADSPYRLRALVVPDAIVTNPAAAALPIIYQEDSNRFGSAFESVSDGPQENDDIVISNPRLELRRYADPARPVQLSGDVLDRYARIIVGGTRLPADREPANRRLTSGGSLLLSSGNTLSLRLQLLSQAGDFDLERDFSGRALLTLDLEDVPGLDQVSLMTTRTAIFEITPRNDGVDFMLPGCGYREVDAPETSPATPPLRERACGSVVLLADAAPTVLNPVTGVRDVDVDDGSLDDGALFLEGNAAPYFRLNDVVSVAIAAPQSVMSASPPITAGQLSSIVVDNVITVPAAAAALADILSTPDELAGTSLQQLTFTGDVAAADARAILEGISITIAAAADLEYSWLRLITVTTTSSPNDGLTGDAPRDARGGGEVTTVKTYALHNDPRLSVTLDDVILDEEDLLQEGPTTGAAVFGAGLEVMDTNENFHGAAIAMVRVTAEKAPNVAANNGVLTPGDGFVAGAAAADFAPANFDFSFDFDGGVAGVTITGAAASTLSATDATNVLRALRFRLAAGNLDPPDEIRFTVTLTPVVRTDVNPDTVTAFKDEEVERFDHAPTITLTESSRTVDEDAGADPLRQIGTAAAHERRQRVTASIVSVALDRSVANNLETQTVAALLAADSWQIETTQTGAAAPTEERILFSYGDLVPNRHGVVIFTLEFGETGDFSPPLPLPHDSVVMEYRLVVAAVNDPIITDPDMAPPISSNEGDTALQPPFIYTLLADGIGEDNDIVIDNPRLELLRYGRVGEPYPDERIVTLDDDEFYANIFLLQLADNRFLTASQPTLTVPSGFQLKVRLEITADWFRQFDGLARLRLDLTDELPTGGVTSSRVLTFDLAPDSDPTDFMVPGCSLDEFDVRETSPGTPPLEDRACGDVGDTAEVLEIVADESANPVTGLVDPDVDGIPIPGTGQVLRGNGAAYFRSSDEVVVTISAPHSIDLTPAELQSIATDNVLTVCEDTPACSISAQSRIIHGGDDYGEITTTVDPEAGTHSMQLDFSTTVPATVARAILHSVNIEVASKDNLEYSWDRLVTVEVTASPNGGLNGDEPRFYSSRNLKTFRLRTDTVGPTLPGDVLRLDQRIADDATGTVPGSTTVTAAQIGNTEVVLMWRPACDRLSTFQDAGDCRYDNAVYQIGITDETTTTEVTETEVTDGEREHFRQQMLQTISNIRPAPIPADGSAPDDTAGYVLLSLADGGTVATLNSRGYRGFELTEQFAEFIAAAGGGRDAAVAVYRVTRADATLIPGRTYGFTVVVTGDVVSTDNPPEDIAGNYPADRRNYDRLMATMSTDLVNIADTGSDPGVLDELESFVAAGGIADYCGGGSDDADGDGFGNAEELRYGLECRDGQNGERITYFGADAPLRITPAMLATGAVEQGFGDNNPTYILVPGTGPLTRLTAAVAAVCSDCDGEVEVRRYTDACQGQADVLACPAAPAIVGSFDSSEDLGEPLRLVWAGQLTGGMPVRGVRNIYVAPPVGFDVETVVLRTEATSVNLPVSVSVSDNAGTFSVPQLSIAGGGQAQPRPIDTALSNTVANEQISVGVEATTRQTVTLASIGNFMFGNVAGNVAGAAPDGLSLADVTPGNNLFAIGNARVEVVVVSLTRPTFALDPAFIPAGNPVYGFALTITPAEDMPAASTLRVVATVRQGASQPAVSAVVGDGATAEDVRISVNFPPATVATAGQQLTLEVTGLDANAAEIYTARFLVPVRTAGVTDADDDGVPDNLDRVEGDDNDGRREAQLYRLVTLGEASGSAELLAAPARMSGVDESGGDLLTIGLGIYANTAAAGGDISSSDYSIALRAAAGVPPLNVGAAAVPPIPVSRIATGVFDYTLSGLANPGGVATVMLPLLRAFPQDNADALIYKFNEDDRWGRFTETEFEKAYSAPAPCPSINAVRAPAARAAWHSAALGVRAGDECLLLQLQDGSVLNDADRTENRVIHDPLALAVRFMDVDVVPAPFSRLLTQGDTNNELMVTARNEMEPGRVAPVSIEVTLFSAQAATDPAQVTVTLAATNDLDEVAATLTLPAGGTDREAEFAVLFELSGEVPTRRVGFAHNLGDPPVRVSVGTPPPQPPTPTPTGGGGGTMEPLWLLLLALGTWILSFKAAVRTGQTPQNTAQTPHAKPGSGFAGRGLRRAMGGGGCGIMRASRRSRRPTARSRQK